MTRALPLLRTRFCSSDDTMSGTREPASEEKTLRLRVVTTSVKRVRRVMWVPARAGHTHQLPVDRIVRSGHPGVKSRRRCDIPNGRFAKAPPAASRLRSAGGPLREELPILVLHDLHSALHPRSGVNLIPIVTDAHSVKRDDRIDVIDDGMNAWRRHPGPLQTCGASLRPSAYSVARLCRRSRWYSDSLALDAAMVRTSSTILGKSFPGTAT